MLIHVLLTSIIQHTCSHFNIPFKLQKYTTSDLIKILSPHITTLRLHCTKCYTFYSHASISEIAHLLVMNKQNQCTLAIDLNVYSKNQQFRLYDCVKQGQNNFLRQSPYFQFNQSFENSYSTLLKKSIITYNIEHLNLPVVYLENNQLKLKHTDLLIVSLLCQHNQNMFIIINQHFESHFIFEINNTKSSFQSNRFKFPQIHKPYDYINLSQVQIEKYTFFVQKLITSDENHQGYIKSCARGTYNKDHIFFNIAANYRFCPRKGSHHKHNTIAILIDTNKQKYTIRCKDHECNNVILTWNSL
ncbi:unnamed protein product [Rotaria magnacalcarata]|uniref:DNA-directed primase/polymerase protein n=2 Tax=Rotaria magnacalcarata TaxID=392030 RepID=A0A815SRV3_9BILA|nr:unnamed protein product [Rotaria magnacalcarata]CAF4183897.1 unnamed protein product [Rotaria magnacalcarata]